MVIFQNGMAATIFIKYVQNISVLNNIRYCALGIAITWGCAFNKYNQNKSVSDTITFPKCRYKYVLTNFLHLHEHTYIQMYN